MEKTIGKSGRTKTQLKAASVRASEARTKRSVARKAVMNGEISVLRLVATSDKDLKRIKVVDLLSWLNNLGEVKALKIMEKLEINENIRIGGLGDLQKIRLCKLVSEIERKKVA